MNSPKRILIVEDNAINRQILCKILRDEYEIIEAEDGLQALEIIQKEYRTLSAIVLDMMMPKMSGRELMKLMSLNKEYQNLPILVATAEHNQDMERESLIVGAWDFVIKPYDPAILKLRLSNIISRSQITLMTQIKELAQRDSLTGIYNRQYFMSQTSEMLQRHPEQQFILLRADIDYFRLYNAAFGAKAGDELLLKISRQIQRDLDRFQVPFYTYGRIESDVFCVCMPYDEPSLMDAIENSNQMLTEMSLSYHLKASFGLYIIEDYNQDMEEIYGHTVEASRICKHDANLLYAYYSREMQEKEQKAQLLSGEMEHAISEKQFQVYLQPKYAVETGKPCGAEALVRWFHPQRGMISPGEFIPVFEQNGMIRQLDYYMWESVCQILGRWIKEGSQVYPVSVNISRISLNNPAIVEQIAALTEKYEVPRELLQLEITESAYMSNPELMKDIIGNFRQLGFVLLMDDFGSGYSSLNTLKNIEMDILKIDMKFLPTGQNNVKSEKILASIARMAGWLGMPVIVEGVETRQQTEFLASIGCTYIQGYYFARPMPVAEYEKLIASQEVVQKDAEEKQAVLVQEFDALWSSDSQTGTLFRSVAVPFAILEYGAGKIDVLRMNDPYRKLLGSKSFEELLNYIELEKLLRVIEQVVEDHENSECECLFTMPDQGTRWQRVRVVFIGTVDKTSLVSITLVDVTTQRVLEKQLNNIFNAMHEDENRRGSLLVVDDMEVSREVLASLFQEEFHVLEAENGKQALDVLKENYNDIAAILLDMVMPEMSGQEFLVYKNAMSHAADIPVIIISAETNETLQINMLESGVNDYVTKPFVPVLVKKRVRNVIDYNSRFRHLLQEYHAANKLAEKSHRDVNLAGYNHQDVMTMMEFMDKIFDVVRLVDPTETAVLHFKEDGSIEREEYRCYEVWGKQQRCENCSSMCALGCHCKTSKFELMKNNIFYIISQPVKIQIAKGVTRDLILEVVSKISDESDASTQEVQDVFKVSESAHDMIYMDPLTSVYNRRYLDEHLFLHRGRNNLATSIAVIMMDLHHFKKINDTYGHIEGDRVLVDVAKALDTQMRDTDTLVRYGGDEFVIVITDCDEMIFPSFIERFQKAVETVAYGPGEAFHVQAEFGYAYTLEYKTDDSTLKNLIQEADQKMYEEKRKNANVVVE